MKPPPGPDLDLVSDCLRPAEVPENPKKSKQTLETHFENKTSNKNAHEELQLPKNGAKTRFCSADARQRECREEAGPEQVTPDLQLEVNPSIFTTTAERR